MSYSEATFSSSQTLLPQIGTSLLEVLAVREEWETSAVLSTFLVLPVRRSDLSV